MLIKKIMPVIFVELSAIFILHLAVLYGSQGRVSREEQKEI